MIKIILIILLFTNIAHAENFITKSNSCNENEVCYPMPSELKEYLDGTISESEYNNRILEIILENEATVG